MSNPFANLSTQGIEEATDNLGGFSVLDSDVYDAVIKIAYAGQSKGGANSVTILADINGREYRETLYVTNKQGENFYINKRDTTKKMPLPGFTTANNVALLATGFELGNLSVEERTIKLWDSEAGADVNTKVQAFVDLTGKPIKIAIMKQLEDKSVSDGNGGYVPTGEHRDTNVIDAVFHSETSRTVSEVKAGAATGEFIGKWLTKNKGQTKDRTTKDAGKTGRPGAPAAGAAKSMFG